MLQNLVAWMDEGFRLYATSVIEKSKRSEEAQQLTVNVADDFRFRLELLGASLADKLWNVPLNLTPELPIAGAAYVLHAAIQSLYCACNHGDDNTYTDEDASEWQREVVAKAQELKRLLAREPQQIKGIDEHLRRSMVSKTKPVMEREHLSTKGTLWPLAFAGVSSVGLVDEIAGAVQSQGISLSTIPARPGRSANQLQVPRLRFCYEMAAYFSEQVTQRHKIIAAFANLLFPDPSGASYRPSQVSRLKSEPFSHSRIAAFDATAGVYGLHNAGTSLPKVIVALTSLLKAYSDK